jgi:hypothetical protein
MPDEEAPSLRSLLDTYVDKLRNELDERWKTWQIDLSQREVHEVTGGLLARQVSLATQLASAPGIWNEHLAPLVLRAMTDVVINLFWILEDPKERARKYILYGLGQEKLLLEHHRQSVRAEGKDPDDDVGIKALASWIDTQRFSFMTEVNVGSWSGIDTRTMAEEAGCIELYRFAYSPWSASAHSTWQHVSRWNLIHCRNPLHRYHRVPYTPELGPDAHYLYVAAKYAEKAFRRFDEKTGVTSTVDSAFDYIVEQLERLAESKAVGDPSTGDNP